MNKFRLDQVLQNMERLKKTLPVLLSNQAQTFFVKSWEKKGWDDKSVVKWDKRKDTGPKSQGRAILVKSGNLRRAVNRSIRFESFDRIQLVVALPYAAVHNDGYNGTRRAHTRSIFKRGSTPEFIGLARKKPRRLKSTPVFERTGEANVKAHTMKMPRRRFMGDSANLRKLQLKLIDKEINKIWLA